MVKITELNEYTIDAEKVYEIEKRNHELRKTAKIVKESSDGIQILQLPDGRIMMHKKGAAVETEYGVAFKCEGEFNEENLAIAKEKALERLLSIIREVVNACPDKFFVIKDTETIKEAYRNPVIAELKSSDEEIDAINYFTVGCKIKLPKVYEEEI